MPSTTLNNTLGTKQACVGENGRVILGVVSVKQDAASVSRSADAPHGEGELPQIEIDLVRRWRTAERLDEGQSLRAALRGERLVLACGKKFPKLAALNRSDGLRISANASERKAMRPIGIAGRTRAEAPHFPSVGTRRSMLESALRA